MLLNTFAPFQLPSQHSNNQAQRNICGNFCWRIRTGCCLICGKNAVFPSPKNTIHMVVSPSAGLGALLILHTGLFLAVGSQEDTSSSCFRQSGGQEGCSSEGGGGGEGQDSGQTPPSSHLATPACSWAEKPPPPRGHSPSQAVAQIFLSCN